MAIWEVNVTPSQLVALEMKKIRGRPTGCKPTSSDSYIPIHRPPTPSQQQATTHLLQESGFRRNGLPSSRRLSSSSLGAYRDLCASLVSDFFSAWRPLHDSRMEITFTLGNTP
ncbi:hypothetical protein AVEN_89526-1 [Araneus ventricosus]|uniref:Uncharacterized protein n=1 Tax=Araneus ventricosus TaxID=182803 RepID=A0A4Y2KKY3_ARAVE|nr:hypothetical protein AVEN_89526-1 [Araneus ventricosus]